MPRVSMPTVKFISMLKLPPILAKRGNGGKSGPSGGRSKVKVAANDGMFQVIRSASLPVGARMLEGCVNRGNSISRRSCALVATG